MASQSTESKAEATAGEQNLSTTNKLLTGGASMIQNFGPLKNICAHLNAFHTYVSDTSRAVEATHFCGHVNDEVRQCIIYDSAEANARIIGIEYMITPRLYETLAEEERKLWHSHIFEVKSGMLVMPQSVVPDAAWEMAETKEMEQVIRLYGKTYHLWQVDRGDPLPLGEPQLMGSFTAPGQLDEELWRARDKKIGTNSTDKAEKRKDIVGIQVHQDADQAWKTGK
jgi:hypothetical protein